MNDEHKDKVDNPIELSKESLGLNLKSLVLQRNQKENDYKEISAKLNELLDTHITETMTELVEVVMESKQVTRRNAVSYIERFTPEISD